MFTPFSYTTIEFWLLTLAGLGLFLFGIFSISKVLKKMASNKLSKVISRCSSNPVLGVLTGAGFTAAIQSSSATNSLVIGLVRAGVMTFMQAAAIIIGSNIGTTITAFIISIPFAEYFTLAILVGSFILLLFTRRKWTNIGELCFAVGCIFFGLTVMSTSLKSLAAEPWFVDLLNGLDKMPWLGLLVGTVLTICLQSSSAVVGVVQGIYAASMGSISLFGILPIILGSNIGTTTTGLIASIGGSKESTRVALFDVLSNIFGALLFMGIIYIFRFFLDTVTANSPVSPELQIALCHLVFNVFTTALYLPLLKPICKFITWIIKDDKNKRTTKIDVKELDNKIIKQFPTEGIILAKEQVIEMFKYSLEMFKTLSLYIENPTADDYQYIKDIEVSIDSIDRNLNDFLMAADKGDLSPKDMSLFLQTLKACKDIERIGDYGENLINFYCPDDDKKINLKESSDYQLFLDTNNTVVSLIEETIDVFSNNDKEKAIEVIKKRRELISDIDIKINEHFNSLSTSNNKSYVYLDYVFVDIMNSYQRVLSHCSNIAKLFGNDKVYIYTPQEEEHFNKMKDRY